MKDSYDLVEVRLEREVCGASNGPVVPFVPDDPYLPGPTPVEAP